MFVVKIKAWMTNLLFHKRYYYICTDHSKPSCSLSWWTMLNDRSDSVCEQCQNWWVHIIAKPQKHFEISPHIYLTILNLFEKIKTVIKIYKSLTYLVLRKNFSSRYFCKILNYQITHICLNLLIDTSMRICISIFISLVLYSLNPYGRKGRGAKKPLDESERGEWKSWLQAQHSENEDQGIWSHQFMGNRLEKQWKQCQTLFWGAPKSLQMVTAAMKLKDAYSLEGKLWPT